MDACIRIHSHEGTFIKGSSSITTVSLFDTLPPASSCLLTDGSGLVGSKQVAEKLNSQIT